MTSRGHHHRRWARRRASRGERGGSSSVEVLLLAPVILMFILIVVAGARVATTGLGMENAARSAARAAALETDPVVARAVAEQVAAAALTSASITCDDPEIVTDTSQFLFAAGLPAEVRVSITCTVLLTDLTGLPGIGSSRTITKTVNLPLDTYREHR